MKRYLLKHSSTQALKHFSLMLIYFTLTSCSSDIPWYKPNGLLFNQMPKGGSPGFNLGWRHGCASGLGTDFSGAIGPTFYTWSKDPDIASSNPNIPRIKERYKEELKDVNWNNPDDIKKNFSDYNTIFWSSYSFCKHSALKSIHMSGYNPPLPGDVRYNPMNHGIGNIYKIDGRGDTRIGGGPGDTSMW